MPPTWPVDLPEPRTAPSLTDQEHATAIAKAEVALNQALAAAHEDGLDTTVSVSNQAPLFFGGLGLDPFRSITVVDARLYRRVTP